MDKKMANYPNFDRFLTLQLAKIAHVFNLNK